MCCFSKTVDEVRDTSIFARSAADGRQYLVYGTTVIAKEDLAMILPLPVPKNTGDDAVRFIDLKGYPEFFVDLHKSFPVIVKKSKKGGFGGVGGFAGGAAPLKVVEVGDFEASFVPNIEAFQRLDARFKLPEGTWESLPQYRQYGFAVFKLKSGAKKLHPMAFEFPRANPKELFFPTVHIHDGKVHDAADFDHSLFCQPTDGEDFDLMQWTESPRLAGFFVEARRTKGIVAQDAHCYRKFLRGRLKNEDIVL